MTTEKKKSGLAEVCVLGANALAVRYLENILLQNSWVVIASNGELLHSIYLPRPRLLVLEGASLPMPLPQLLQLSLAGLPSRRHLLIDSPRPPDELVELLRIGLHGYLTHDQVETSLTAALVAVNDSSLWLPAEVLRLYVETKSISMRHPGHLDQMTDRESEILALVKSRLSNKEIGAILHIRESTVKFHLSNIFAKRKVQRRRDLFSPAVLRDPFRRAS